MEENASEIPNPNMDNRNTAKKRSRSTKKSLAVENEQRQRFLNTLLDSDSLPDNVKEILKEEVFDFAHKSRSVSFSFVNLS